MRLAKFQNYQYGGRPLGLAFNARWKDFSLPNAGGASSGDMQGGEMEQQTGNGYDEQEQQPAESAEQPMESA